MPTTPPVPTDADGGHEKRTRERLLAAATQVLAERGYDRAAVTDIARRAGLTTGAIYANFRDKAEMLLELICALEERQDSNMMAMQSRADVDPDLFLQDTRDWVDPALADDRALVLESRVACRRDPAVRERLQDIERRRLAAVSDLITMVQRGGIVRTDIDPETLALFILSIPLGITVLEATGLPLPPQDNWTVLIQCLIAAFLVPQE